MRTAPDRRAAGLDDLIHKSEGHLPQINPDPAPIPKTRACFRPRSQELHTSTVGGGRWPCFSGRRARTTTTAASASCLLLFRAPAGRYEGGYNLLLEEGGKKHTGMYYMD